MRLAWTLIFLWNPTWLPTASTSRTNPGGCLRRLRFLVSSPRGAGTTSLASRWRSHCWSPQTLWPPPLLLTHRLGPPTPARLANLWTRRMPVAVRPRRRRSRPRRWRTGCEFWHACGRRGSCFRSWRCPAKAACSSALASVRWGSSARRHSLASSCVFRTILAAATLTMSRTGTARLLTL